MVMLVAEPNSPGGTHRHARLSRNDKASKRQAAAERLE